MSRRERAINTGGSEAHSESAIQTVYNMARLMGFSAEDADRLAVQIGPELWALAFTQLTIAKKKAGT